MVEALRVTLTLTLPAHLLEFAYTLSGGKGGQHAQKNDTKVQLHFDLRGCELLDASVKQRMIAAKVGRLTKEGKLILTSERYRSQKRNVDDVRTKLSGLIRDSLQPPKKRRSTRPSRGQRAQRLESKRKQSARKESRKKVPKP
jgi:ribosome-associated protein